MEHTQFESILEAYPVRLATFEGPLDLLLHLIKKHEVDIYDIPIVVVTQQYLDYIDLMRAVRAATGARAAMLRIPYSAFWLMLKAYALLDRDPPFTAKQLEALVTPDYFEVIDWPHIFGVSATPLAEALRETFQNPVYSKVVLEF